MNFAITIASQDVAIGKLGEGHRGVSLSCHFLQLPETPTCLRIKCLIEKKVVEVFRGDTVLLYSKGVYLLFQENLQPSGLLFGFPHCAGRKSRHQRRHFSRPGTGTELLDDRARNQTHLKRNRKPREAEEGLLL